MPSQLFRRRRSEATSELTAAAKPGQARPVCVRQPPHDHTISISKGSSNGSSSHTFSLNGECEHVNSSQLESGSGTGILNCRLSQSSLCLSLSAQPHQKSPPPPPPRSQSPHLMIRRRLREPVLVVLMAALDPLSLFPLNNSKSVGARADHYHQLQLQQQQPWETKTETIIDINTQTIAQIQSLVSLQHFLLALIVCKDRAQGLVFKQRPKADFSLVSHSLFCLFCTQHFSF